MKFKLSRTSMWNEKPLGDKRVKKMMFENWDSRTCTEEYFNNNDFLSKEGLWRSRGTNHQKINNGKGIMRRLDDNEEWGIEINSLEELMEFAKDNGELIIGFSNNVGSIEIYDDYRE